MTDHREDPGPAESRNGSSPPSRGESASGDEHSRTVALIPARRPETPPKGVRAAGASRDAPATDTASTDTAEPHVAPPDVAGPDAGGPDVAEPVGPGAAEPDPDRDQDPAGLTGPVRPAAPDGPADPRNNGAGSAATAPEPTTAPDGPFPTTGLNRRDLKRLGVIGAVIVLLGAVVGLGASLLWPAEYAGRASVLYIISQEQPTGFLREDRNLTTQSMLAESNAVLGPVSAQYGLSPAGLAQKLTVTVPDGSELLEFEVHDPSPDLAVRLADSVTKQYLQVSGSSQPSSDQMRYLQGQITAAQNQMQQLRVDGSAPALAQLPAVADRAGSLSSQLDTLMLAQVAQPQAQIVVPRLRRRRGQPAARVRRCHRSRERAAGSPGHRRDPRPAMAAPRPGVVTRIAAGSAEAAAAPPPGPARGSITVAGWTVVSRGTGLLRVVAIGAVLGPTSVRQHLPVDQPGAEPDLRGDGGTRARADHRARGGARVCTRRFQRPRRLLEGLTGLLLCAAGVLAVVGVLASPLAACGVDSGHRRPGRARPRLPDRRPAALLRGAPGASVHGGLPRGRRPAGPAPVRPRGRRPRRGEPRADRGGPPAPRGAGARRGRGHRVDRAGGRARAGQYGRGRRARRAAVRRCRARRHGPPATMAESRPRGACGRLPRCADRSGSPPCRRPGYSSCSRSPRRRRAG